MKTITTRCLYLLLAVGMLSACTEATPDNTEWTLYGNNFSNQRFSTLAEINRNNVSRLQLVWRYKTGKKATFQTNPLIKDGVMYVTTPYNDAIALDAATGRKIWRYHHKLRGHEYCCGPANRGAALSHGKVIFGTIDARLIALDQKTGSVVWDVPVTDPDAGNEESLAPALDMAELAGARKTGFSGYTVNMAPQVFENRVYVGISGAGYGLHLEQEEDGKAVLSVGGFSAGEHGLRGFIAAFDVNTGEEVWRWHTVTGPAWTGDYVEKTAYGHDLNRDIDQEKAAAVRYRESWRLGGGSVFTTPALDPERGLLFLGTGNPSPQMDDTIRPGDNLHTVSLVALDARTGEKVWHYQQVPHDRWGYDVASPPVLFDIERNGNTVPVVGQASKLGWLFVHHRETGELIYKSEAFSPQENLFARPSTEGVRIAPGTLGAISWTPVALNPETDTVFIPGIYQAAMFYTRQLTPAEGGREQSYSFFKQAAENDRGILTAINTQNGRIRWQKELPDPLVGGALTTASGLVFTGEGNGDFNALDGATGDRLWQFKSQYGVNAPPVSYAVNGKQYVAVAAGGNSLFGYPTGDEILVFSLQ